VISLADYLRKIEPRQVDYRGRYKPVPESRLRTFAAAREVLTNNNMATATLAAAVAITTTAAHKPCIRRVAGCATPTGSRRPRWRNDQP
jgi:hypothetical protein